jgi:hypothetical protein
MSRNVKTSLRQVFFLSRLLGVFPLRNDLKCSWPWLLYSLVLLSWNVYQFCLCYLMIQGDITENLTRVQFSFMMAVTVISFGLILTKSGRLRLCLARWIRVGRELHKIGVINNYENEINFIDQFVGILNLVLYLILCFHFTFKWELTSELHVFSFNSLAIILITNQITSLLRYLRADFRRLNVHLALRRPQTILSLVRAHESLTQVNRMINDVFSKQLVFITTAYFLTELKSLQKTVWYFYKGWSASGCVFLYWYCVQYYEIHRLVSLTSSISNKVRFSQ